MKILLAIHSLSETKLLQHKLSQFGWTIDRAEDRKMVTFHLKTATYDLLFFSPSPKNAQAEVRTLKTEFPRLPLLICADSPLQQCDTKGMEFIDTINKPYHFRELVSRILLLIHEREHSTGVLQCKDLRLNISTKQVAVKGHAIRLPRKEFQLLELLIRNKNQVVSRTQILDNLWERDTDPLTNAVEVHISRLRKRLARKRSTNLIQTAYGFGYIVKE